MEESDLLKERLLAITEKYHIQEDIRQKKVELDQEKLKLQHLKKKALREQWLLQEPASHIPTDSRRRQSLLSDRKQSRQLQLNIQRIEVEVESLEREESVISTNESCILRRLQAVEKSPEDIIKEAKDTFLAEPLHVLPINLDVPQSLPLRGDKHSEPDPSRKTPFAFSINVNKHLLTGESTVQPTATVPPEVSNQHARLNVYDDGRKCVHDLNSQEGSHDQSCVSDLSANEVENLLRSATLQRQGYQQGYQQIQSTKEKHCFYNRDERDREQLVRNSRGQDGLNLIPTHNNQHQANWNRRAGVEHYRRQEGRTNQSNLIDTHHYGNQKDHPHHSYQVRRCHNAEEDASCHTNGISRSHSRLNGGRANGCSPPRSHEWELASAYQPQLSYTPANYIPLGDYISVDEEGLSLNPSSRQSHNGEPANVLSPLYADDPPYTILNAMDTTQPITAIFMGFQTAEDHGRHTLQLDSSLKAELVILNDSQDNCPYDIMSDKHQPLSTARTASGHICPVDGRTEKKREKKHQPCCTVC